MSLKAKIEAVIYASEEPVTLAQLVGLLGEEGQAELDAQRSQQTLLDLDEASEPESGDPDALNAELLAPEPEPAPDEPATDAEAAPIAETDPAAVDERKLAREAAQETKAREKALRDHFHSLLEQLMSDYASDDRGIEVREVAGGYRLATKPEYHDAVRGFVKSLKPPLKLSLQALETLAVVAYKQPVTAPEISEIRGVDSGGVLGGLIARKLITTAGRKQVIGRPILYKTTKDFLVRFGLKDVNELPSIEEFEKMAGELADADPVQEEIPMPHAHEDADEVEPMADVHEPQSDGDSTPTDEEEEEQTAAAGAE
ncbi:MAG TPA: SMC-Scp complex subunit ScpB [Acidobacteriaceae bacterium]|nr:SMC-Scp complex subunit ScpB [Acidobacteriaceae bacterium]